MVQSVEVLLDEAGDGAIRADWDLLEQAGLRTPARHRSASSRPHITLAVADRMPAPLEDALALLRPELGMPLVIGGLLIFGHRRMILARSVAPSAALLDLHRAVATVMAPAGSPPDNLRPDRWTPHVTLARGVDRAGLDRAAAAISDRRVDATAVGLRRWDGGRRIEWLLAGRAL